MYTLLAIDDEPHVLSALQRELQQLLHSDALELALTIHAFTEPQPALDFLEAVRVDCILSDYRMPAMDGITFLKAARRIQPHAGLMMLSGYADQHAMLAAINELHIDRFLQKPWDIDEVLFGLFESIQQQQLRHDNSGLVNLYRQSQRHSPSL